MLKHTSQEFRKFFFIKFTKELIKQSAPVEVIRLEELTKQKPIEEQVEKTIKHKKAINAFMKETGIKPPKQFKPLPRPYVRQRPMPRRPLMIPEHPLPSRLQYIKPAPTTKQIDLGKLNPFIQDLTIKSIECNGPGENIKIRTPQVRETKVSLTKQEIDDIIKKFSELTKIPAHKGILKMAYGRLILSAIISEITGTKFIIKKMIPNLLPPNR